MKKLLLIGLLLLTLSVALFACDGADPSVPTEEDTLQTDPTTSESYTDVTAEPPSEETGAVTPEEETTVPEEPSQTSEESDTLPDGDAEETSALPPSDEDTSHEETLLWIVTVVHTWRLRVDTIRKSVDCEEVLTLDEESETVDLDLLCPLVWECITELS